MASSAADEYRAGAGIDEESSVSAVRGERRRAPSSRALWGGDGDAGRSSMSKQDRRDRKHGKVFIAMELLIRFFQMASAAIAIAAIVTADQAGYSFRDYQAFCYLLAAASAVLAWSTGGFLLDFAKLLPDWLALHLGFLLDLLMSILALSAAAAALGLLRFFDQGLWGGGGVLLMRGACQGTGLTRWCARTKTAASFMVILGALYVFSNIWTAMKSIIARYEREPRQG